MGLQRDAKLKKEKRNTKKLILSYGGNLIIQEKTGVLKTVQI